MLKLRKVCDACTASKVKCDGKTPCSRCEKKSLQCHYRPFRHQKDTASASLQESLDLTFPHTPSSANSTPNDAVQQHQQHGHFFFEEYERKTWSVFFTLYKKLLKGQHRTCSAVWYDNKLSNMLQFLQSRADRATLERFNAWVNALGIVITPPVAYPPPIPLQGVSHNVVAFPELMGNLIQDATSKNLPMIQCSPEGRVRCNAQMFNRFACEESEFQRILDESAGGFLPYGADIIARLVCREKDLATFIQMVSLNIDSMGPPLSVPSTRSIPAQSYIHVQARRDASEANTTAHGCIVRAVYLEQLESIQSKSYYFVMVFDIGDALVPSLPSNGSSNSSSGFIELPTPSPPPEVNNSEPAIAAKTTVLEAEAKESKRHRLFEEDLLDDSSWLDSLMDDDYLLPPL